MEWRLLRDRGTGALVLSDGSSRLFNVETETWDVSRGEGCYELAPRVMFGQELLPQGTYFCPSLQKWRSAAAGPAGWTTPPAAPPPIRTIEMQAMLTQAVQQTVASMQARGQRLVVPSQERAVMERAWRPEPSSVYRTPPPLPDARRCRYRYPSGHAYRGKGQRCEAGRGTHPKFCHVHRPKCPVATCRQPVCPPDFTHCAHHEREFEQTHQAETREQREAREAMAALSAVPAWTQLIVEVDPSPPDDRHVLGAEVKDDERRLRYLDPPPWEERTVKRSRRYEGWSKGRIW